MINHIKQRWLPAMLCAFILSFTILVFGPIDIFVGNRVEFTFSISDFIAPMLLMALGATAVLFAVLIVLPNKIYPAVAGCLAGTAIMLVAQSMFLNRGVSSLPDGETADRIGLPMLIIDTLLWVMVTAFCVWAAYRLKKFDILKTVSLIMALVVCGMSLVGAASDILTLANSHNSADAEADESISDSETQTLENAESTETGDSESETTAQKIEYGIHYLSSKGICEVAPKNNVIVFLLDRFDVKYYERVINSEGCENFFDALDGFTYFSDNTSYYTATYPSICHMITGAKQDFSKPASTFFEEAYSQSEFLKDLSENDYSIRLYTGSYYAYRDATVMPEYIENAAVTGHYVVVDRSALLYQMFILSVYRYVPSFAKTLMPEKWFSFKSVTDVDDTGDSVYTLNDSGLYDTLSNGLVYQTSEHENAYIFYHLNGCHYPVDMNENCEYDTDASVKEATIGCFKLIYNYIDELKRMGLYENATIIITGDHSAGYSDVEGAAPVNGTALFFKPSCESGDKLKYSSAQVCDDNMFASIVKSANIRTQNNYGKGYTDISEGEQTERYMKRFCDAKDEISYTITGSWIDKDNWVETGTREIKDFYG